MDGRWVTSAGTSEPSKRSMEELKISQEEESSCPSIKRFCSMEEPIKNTSTLSSEFTLAEHCSTQTGMNTHTLVETRPHSEQPEQEVLPHVLETHKTAMKKKYEGLFEGIKTMESEILLKEMNTQLFIIEGQNKEGIEGHEVLQIDFPFRKNPLDTPVHCSDIFKPLQGSDGGVKAEDLRLRDRKEDKGAEELEIRSVLTKGIAGIGKTVSVQKFILDWAEGAANQEVDLMFVLPFRELNLIKDDQYSLHGLLCAFHPELRHLDPEIYDQLRAVFIFDGLDESRVPLDFEQCEEVSDITMTSSVGVLMTNLIRGDLLPSALIWITSRPAAANQIPPQYIHRVTEIQGFTDPQKEEYFRKRIRDQDQAQKIISHIKTSRSLHIMCHIPVFCWISATVLQRIITQSHTEIPKTLTEMYSHFLLTLTNTKKEKYEDKEEIDPKKLLDSNGTELLKLAELAFTQLLKGNVVFYEEDLRESSIDVTEASVYSGIFTEIFREECVIHQRKVYCFVHLSFQEFLAAVFVFHCYENNIMEPLLYFKLCNARWYENAPLAALLCEVTDKAIQVQNGHLDLFLRFLLGISLESNQSLIQGLLTQIHDSSSDTKEKIKYLIKQNSLSTERSINLFLCLSEMKDQSLYREIEEFLKSQEELSEEYLSAGYCSALAYVLLTSEEELEELDLNKFDTSEEGYRRLIPAVTVCRKARLHGCCDSEASCEVLGSALQSAHHLLKELDLNNNNLKDSGVELLSTGIKSKHCNLKTLKLSGCSLTMISCKTLGSVLQSLNSSLKELDLSNNDLQDSGVELLSAALKSPLCKLETLRLAMCSLGENSCKSLGSALQSVNSLKDLDLSNNDLQDSGVELLSAALKSPLCKLETFILSGCMITERSCFSLASALKSNPSHLRELDLSYNNPRESGVKLLSDLLQDPHCALGKLQAENGGEIRIKTGLKKYACDLTLDPNTLNSCLLLSEGNRKVESVGVQPYPDHPDRFDKCAQVLSVESLTGRCYWEVECSTIGSEIAVSYKGIIKKGDECDEYEFGYNDQSWSLDCTSSRHTVDEDPVYSFNYSVRHKKKETYACRADSPCVRRVAVYLDWEAGILSFYAISSHTHTHLYTFYTTFTEPLYAGFECMCGSVRLCELD